MVGQRATKGIAQQLPIMQKGGSEESRDTEGPQDEEVRPEEVWQEGREDQGKEGEEGGN